jgi:hypothetical protein
VPKLVAELVERLRRLRGFELERGDDPLNPIVDDLVENVALVLEVAVEGAVADPELFRDIRDP